MNADFETTATGEFHFTTASSAGQGCDHCGERFEWGQDATVVEVTVGAFTTQFWFHQGDCEEAANEGFQS